MLESVNERSKCVKQREIGNNAMLLSVLRAWRFVCMCVFHTRAWKDDTEKMPRRPMDSLVGREATASRRFGFGSSPPCRLER